MGAYKRREGGGGGLISGGMRGAYKWSGGRGL